MSMIFKWLFCLTSCILATGMNADVLKVHADNWAPYNYVENDRIVGISTELVEATLMRANIPYELVVMPWKRGYRETQTRKNSLLFTVNRTKRREALFKWVGPLFESQVYLHRLKSRDDITVTNLDDVKDYRVGILRGGSVQGYLDAHGFSEENYYLSSKADLLLKILFADRVDLIPGDRLDLAYQLNQSGRHYSDLEKALFLYGGSYYIAVNKDTSDEIVEQLQTALNELVSEGMQDQLINKYLSLQE